MGGILWNRSAFLAAAVFAVLVVRAELAVGCSCATSPHPRDRIELTDAAFIGVLIDRRPVTAPSPGGPPSRGDYVNTFRVDEAFKGPLGPTIDVVSGANAASCGITPEPGKPTGLVVWRADGAWRTSTCGGVVDPRELRRAAQPLPAPRRGSGPVALLAGGDFPEGRLLALDRNGWTLRQGKGGGATSLLSMCPGSRTVAEVVLRPRGPSVALRDVRTLRVRREVALPASAVGDREVRAARCLTRRGDRVAVFAGGIVTDSKGRPRSSGRVLMVRSRRVRVIRRVPAVDAALDDRHAYLLRGRRAPRVSRLELSTGRVRSLARVSGDVSELALSPGGGRLAFHEVRVGPQGGGGTRLVTLGTTPGRVRPRSREVSATPQSGRAVWLEAGRLASLLADSDGRVAVYDGRLSPRGSFAGWTADVNATRGGRLYGLDRDYLQVASLPGGPASTVRRLGRLKVPYWGPGPAALTVVPGGVRLAPARPSAAPRAASTRWSGPPDARAPWCRTGDRTQA